MGSWLSSAFRVITGFCCFSPAACLMCLLAHHCLEDDVRQQVYSVLLLFNICLTDHLLFPWLSYTICYFFFLSFVASVVTHCQCSLHNFFLLCLLKKMYLFEMQSEISFICRFIFQMPAADRAGPGRELGLPCG